MQWYDQLLIQYTTHNKVIYCFGHEEQMLHCYAAQSPETAEQVLLNSFEQSLL